MLVKPISTLLVDIVVAPDQFFQSSCIISSFDTNMFVCIE